MPRARRIRNARYAVTLRARSRALSLSLTELLLVVLEAGEVVEESHEEHLQGLVILHRRY